MSGPRRTREEDAALLLALIQQDPGDTAQHYARTLNLPTKRVRDLLFTLRDAGHLTARRREFVVYTPREASE